jgi:hypothetical protein
MDGAAGTVGRLDALQILQHQEEAFKKSSTLP